MAQGADRAGAWRCDILRTSLPLRCCVQSLTAHRLPARSSGWSPTVPLVSPTAQEPAAQPIWGPRDTPTRVISSLDLRRMHDAAVCEGKARVA